MAAILMTLSVLENTIGFSNLIYVQLVGCDALRHTGLLAIEEPVVRFIILLPFTNLARSAKVAERAICFTDRNFYLFFSFFLSFLMISRRQII